MNKKISSFGTGILMLVVLFGCAAPGSNMNTGGIDGLSAVSKETGGAYQPKLPPGIQSIDAAKADLARLLENRNILFGITFGSGNYYSERDLNLYANQPHLAELNKGHTGGVSRQYDSNNRLQYMLFKRVAVLDDRIEISPRIIFSYADLTDVLLSVTTSKDKDPYIYTVQLRDQILFHFHRGDLSGAQRFADALFFIQQAQKKQRDERLALFESKAAEYRTMAVKPPVTEEQRKYIVQANALNQKKDYRRAIDLYLKALDIDPVSYPGAYFNMALLSGQLQWYKSAITYMKQYLMLEPDAKDARSAQDKIYEWELLMNR